MSRNIKLGIAPINWCNDDMPDLGKDISLEQCLSEMKESGFAGTELGHKFPNSAQELSKILATYNLSLASAWHSTYFVENDNINEEVNKLKTRCNFLLQVGCKTINLAECSFTIHGTKNISISQRPVFTKEQWKKLIAGMNQAGQLCNDLGMKACYHHHIGTGVQTEQEVERLMDNTIPERVYLCADTGHIYFAGTEPLSLFQKYISRIGHIHLKDIRKEIMQKVYDRSFLDGVLAGVFTVPGDGVIEYQPIFDLILSSDYHGWMIVEAEQDPTKAHPLTYAKKARDYIKQLTSL